jgi:acyl dehydratase
MVRYLEDFTPGETIELGSTTVTEEAIIAFAREFDPQPFHVNPARAADSAYGGLIASGWHTMGLFMRLAVDGLLIDTSSMGSPGVDQLRWLKPVRPGDTLRARMIINETTPSRSRADRGTLRSRGELYNAGDELVMTVEIIAIFGRRPE